MALKSSNLEAALTSSLVAESHAAAEAYRGNGKQSRRYTNLKNEIDRTVSSSPSKSNQWSRLGLGEVDEEKTTMIPATTKDEPLLIVSELRDMLLDLWNQLHRVELNGGSEFASSLMSGAPETVQALEEWCDAHPESELTMRGIECTWCSSAKCENVTSYTHESNTH